MRGYGRDAMLTPLFTHSLAVWVVLGHVLMQDGQLNVNVALLADDSISGEELGAMLGEMLAGMHNRLCADA
ncbi:MAG: hypothetical protein HC767_13920 [Akkermansiaceae bacterium]|nr:hypothetical protein [Akkermansiaceae bacterium]